MNTPTLYLTVGIPGSGKTTWAKSQNLPIVSRDTIRKSLLQEGEPFYSHEEEVGYLFPRNIALRLKKGEDVIADATHINAQSRKRVLDTLKQYNVSPKVVFVEMETSLANCLLRNATRTGLSKVDEKAIASMFINYQHPSTEEYPNSKVIKVST